MIGGRVISERRTQLPHCILEYSANVPDQVDIRALLAEINQSIVACSDVKIEDIKSRAIRHEQYVIGDGAAGRTFVTLEIQILSGRPDHVKTLIAKAAHDVVLRWFPITAVQTKASITVQITDIHAPSYARYRSYQV